MMKNKAVAVVLVIVALGVLGFVYKTQFMPQVIEFTLKAEDGTIFEKVLLPETTVFPITKDGKACKSAKKYWDTKAKKEVYLTDDDKVGPDLLPGGKPIK